MDENETISKETYQKEQFNLECISLHRLLRLEDARRFADDIIEKETIRSETIATEKYLNNPVKEEPWHRRITDRVLKWLNYYDGEGGY